jgi:hypothetical protein
MHLFEVPIDIGLSIGSMVTSVVRALEVSVMSLGMAPDIISYDLDSLAQNILVVAFAIELLLTSFIFTHDGQGCHMFVQELLSLCMASMTWRAGACAA